MRSLDRSRDVASREVAAIADARHGLHDADLGPGEIGARRDTVAKGSETGCRPDGRVRTTGRRDELRSRGARPLESLRGRNSASHRPPRRAPSPSRETARRRPGTRRRTRRLPADSRRWPPRSRCRSGRKSYGRTTKLVVAPVIPAGSSAFTVESSFIAMRIRPTSLYFSRYDGLTADEGDGLRARACFGGRRAEGVDGCRACPGRGVRRAATRTSGSSRPHSLR